MATSRDASVVYPYNARKHFPIADDKVLAKEYLGAAGVPVPATLFVARRFTDLTPFLETITCPVRSRGATSTGSVSVTLKRRKKDIEDGQLEHMSRMEGGEKSRSSTTHAGSRWV